MAGRIEDQAMAEAMNKQAAETLSNWRMTVESHWFVRHAMTEMARIIMKNPSLKSDFVKVAEGAAALGLWYEDLKLSVWHIVSDILSNPLRRVVPQWSRPDNDKKPLPIDNKDFNSPYLNSGQEKSHIEFARALSDTELERWIKKLHGSLLVRRSQVNELVAVIAIADREMGGRNINAKPERQN